MTERAAARHDVVTFGDRALRFGLPPSLDRPALLAHLREQVEVEDVVLAEELGAVVLARGASLTRGRGVVETALARFALSVPDRVTQRHVVPVIYDGDDLAAVAAAVGMTAERVVALHVAAEYEVATLGFLPGFAYLTGLDPRLVLARRPSPRTRVPPRAVAIAAQYTGVYPFASPGGWHLLGEAPGFVALGPSGSRFGVGDRVRFEPTERTTSRGVSAPSKRDAPPGPYLEVQAVRGPALVMDGGRPGRMHEGVPPGGPLVPDALSRANRAVENPPGAAGLEVYGGLTLVARGGRVLLAHHAGRATELGPDESFTFVPDRRARVGYLAMRGGVDVPCVLGGRGTLLVAGLGGLEGRVLRRGDRLAVGSCAAPRNGSDDVEEGDDAEAIAVALGPDVTDAAAATSLSESVFRVSAASDRTGTRLEGPALAQAPASASRTWRSSPMVVGAIQSTPTGLIVLGPDHPTTGGYPVVAVLRRRALAPFFRRPFGASVRFVVTP